MALEARSILGLRNERQNLRRSEAIQMTGAARMRKGAPLPCAIGTHPRNFVLSAFASPLLAFSCWKTFPLVPCRATHPGLCEPAITTDVATKSTF